MSQKGIAGSESGGATSAEADVLLCGGGKPTASFVHCVILYVHSIQQALFLHIPSSLNPKVTP